MKLLTRFYRFITRHDARLRRQHKFIRSAGRCRVEKAWMAARRDITSLVHGEGSPQHAQARQDYAIVSWGHFMVGEGGDVMSAYPMPIHLVTKENADAAKAILRQMNEGCTSALEMVKRDLQAPLDTTKF